MGVTENLEKVRTEIPSGVVLVAVSKTKPDEMVREAYGAGHRDFGENKVQDLVARQERLPGDIRWHMVGHLQRNKVKYLAPFVHLIHSVDSMKLLRVIEKEAVKAGRTIDCLLQVRIAREETKFGLPEAELLEMTGSDSFRELAHVRIRGLMGMATFTEDSEQIREEFRSLKRIFDRLKGSVFAASDAFDHCSFGMSGDYKLAIGEGTTMVRIGSLIFGPREYK